MRKTESQKIALCGVLGALSVVLLLVGAALQIGTYAAPMLAAFLLIPVLDEYGKLLGVNSLRTLVLYNADRLMGDIMYDDIISCLPSEEEEDVAADIFKYDIPAMPVVDEHGTLLGIVTTDDAWDAIEDDVAGDKTKMNVLSIAGITVASLMGLFLYSLILLQLAGSLHLGGLHY